WTKGSSSTRAASASRSAASSTWPCSTAALASNDPRFGEMNMLETMNMQGRVRLLGQTADGLVVLDRIHANRIVQSGRELVARLFAGVPGTPPAIVSH